MANETAQLPKTTYAESSPEIQAAVDYYLFMNILAPSILAASAHKNRLRNDPLSLGTEMDAYESQLAAAKLQDEAYQEQQTSFGKKRSEANKKRDVVDKLRYSADLQRDGAIRQRFFESSVKARTGITVEQWDDLYATALRGDESLELPIGTKEAETYIKNTRESILNHPEFLAALPEIIARMNETNRHVQEEYAKNGGQLPAMENGKKVMVNAPSGIKVYTDRLDGIIALDGDQYQIPTHGLPASVTAGKQQGEPTKSAGGGGSNKR